MGRELRRKQAKKEGKNVREVQKKLKKNKELTPKKFIIILGILAVFFIILYLITGIFVTKDIKWFDKNSSTSNENTGSSIANKILANESLRQKEEEYYVYYYNTKEEDTEVSNTIASLEKTVYRVDLSDDFNSNFVGDASGIVDNIEDLKVTDPTVVKVSDEKIVEFYSGKEEIVAALR